MSGIFLRGSYIPLLLTMIVAYLLVKKDPTPQPQNPVFRTNIDAGRDEAIHPILLRLSLVQQVRYAT